MTISLQKGGNVNLSKEAPGLSEVAVGLGWDVRATDGAAYDLDANCFLLNATGKVRSDSDFIFYNNKKTPDNSVEHMGDNTTGAGDAFSAGAIYGCLHGWALQQIGQLANCLGSLATEVMGSGEALRVES